MPVYLDVESRLDRRTAEAAAREVTQLFSRVGADISGNLGRSLSKGLGAFDTSAARAQLLQLESAWRRAADVEVDAARRMEVAAKRAAEATAKFGADSAKAMQAQAVAARSQRDYTDALVANEAAHKSHTKAMEDSAATAGVAARAFNAAGIGSLAVFTGSVLEATRKAGDFQQSQQRLVASAGETAAGLKTVSDGILTMAGQVGYSSQELSKGMYTVEKAGYRGADGVNVLRSAAQLAKAENADLGEVLNGLTTSMHDFGYSSDRSAEVASKMNTAVGMAKTNLQEFSGALHSVEPIAAAANIKLEDVYGSLAQITQSGTSADQGAQNMAHSISQLMKPSQQMRDEMGQLGLDARDVQAHLGDRGFAGTVQMLSNTIRDHMNPAGQVVIDTMFKSQQATDAATQIFNHLPPAAKAVAESIQNGTLSYKEFRKTRGGLDVEQANELNQWNNLNNKVQGYSAALKSGQGDIQTYEQALALMTGGQDSLRTVLQLVGENAGATNDKIKAIKDTTAETDGTVKGFNETQETLNAKMADAKAAFGAAAIEIGSAFVPFMTDAANVAKDVGDWMGKHPAIMHAAVDALGALGGAWLGFKAIDVVGSLLKPIASTLGEIVVAEEGATAATAGLGRALSGLKTAGLLGVGAQLGGQWAQDHTDPGSFWNSAAVVGTDAGTGAAAGAAIGSIIPVVGTGVGAGVGALVGGGIGLYNQIAGHAAGGPLHASGPKGHDSALFWGADGEHVLTHHEVQKMGGHSGVYAFRQALMGNTVLGRAPGGPIGSDPGDASGGNFLSALQRAGIDPRMYPLIQGFAKTEGNNPSGVPTLGFTDSQAGSTLSGHAAALAAQLQARQSVAGAFPVGGSPQQQASWMATVVGQNGVQSDWQGNAQPSRQDYINRIVSAWGGKVPVGAENDPVYVSLSQHGTPGRGPQGQAGFYTQNASQVSSAQERLRHIDEEIRIAEERKQNMKADASQAEKDRLNEEIRHLHAERDQAQGRLAKAQQGTFHGGRGGMSGNPFLPVPLADKFGLGKGLPGLVEYGIGALEDLVLGPLETAAWGALGQAFGAGVPGPGDAGFGAPGLPAELSSFAAGGGGGSATGGRGSTGSGGGGGHGSSSWWDPSNANAGHGSNFYKQWYPRQHPAANFYKQWYPKQSATDVDRLPPDFVAFARQQGWIRPDGSYAGPPLQSPPPGSLTNPKSVAPSVKMHPDLSRLGGNAKGPLPVGPPQPPGPPHTDATKNQPWFGGPGRGDTGLNVPKVWGQLQQFFDFNQPGFATGGAVPETHIPANPHQTEEDQVVRQLVPWQNPKTGLPSYTLRGKGFDDPSLMQGTHFATGGPSGTDIIPAWLSPNEHVLTSDDVDALGGQSGVYAFRNALHARYGGAVYLDDGGAPGQQNVQQQAQSGLPNVKDPGSQKQSGSAPGMLKSILPGGQANQPGPPGPGAPMPQGPQATGMGAVTQGAQQAMSNVAAAGANVQHPEDSMPASSGIGFSGGIVGAAEGAAEGAASAAGNAFAPGAGSAASSAMQIGFQELNRAAAYGAQVGGILTEGALETIMPSDSSTNWMQTIPGRLLSGIAGARPENPNTAGQTKLPVQGNNQPGGYSPTGGGQNMYGGAPGGHTFNVNGDVHVSANDPQQLGDGLSDHTMTAAEGMYPGGFVAGRGGMNGPI